MSILNYNKQYIILHNVVLYIDIQNIKSYNNIMKQNNRSKIGFTLAEVLITLGIIGVVAALTLPSLITSYKRQEASARLIYDGAGIDSFCRRKRGC